MMVMGSRRGLLLAGVCMMMFGGLGCDAAKTCVRVRVPPAPSPAASGAERARWQAGAARLEG
jgi:hypothetical protein